MDSSYANKYKSHRLYIWTTVLSLVFLFGFVFAQPQFRSQALHMIAGIAVAHESTTVMISQQLLDRIVQEVQEVKAENTRLRAKLGEKGMLSEKPHIMIVAGHTAKSSGAGYRGLTEYELNYETMQYVGRLLEESGDYEVTLSHKGADYNPEILEYINTNEQKIIDFYTERRQTYARAYPQGDVTNDTDHNYASTRGTIELFGVNKWTGENDVDVVVHIHFNDYPGRPYEQVGKHTGFSIFTPLKTNDHFVPSFELAKAIEREMLKHDKRSTVLQESAGVLESELIAVGQANSVDIPVVLVEGGFIYESRFTNPEQRSQELQTIAESIYKGIESYVQAD